VFEVLLNLLRRRGNIFVTRQRYRIFARALLPASRAGYNGQERLHESAALVTGYNCEVMKTHGYQPVISYTFYINRINDLPAYRQGKFKLTKKLKELQLRPEKITLLNKIP
jgi:hypothetical protein